MTLFHLLDYFRGSNFQSVRSTIDDYTGNTIVTTAILSGSAAKLVEGDQLEEGSLKENLKFYLENEEYISPLSD